jgi:hypothetical protein
MVAHAHSVKPERTTIMQTLLEAAEAQNTPSNFAIAAAALLSARAARSAHSEQRHNEEVRSLHEGPQGRPV